MMNMVSRDGPRRVRCFTRQRQPLGGPAGEVAVSAAPSCGRAVMTPGARAMARRSMVMADFEIAVGLRHPAEPRDRVGFDIRPIETLGQLSRLGRVLFHGRRSNSRNRALASCSTISQRRWIWPGSR